MGDRLELLRDMAGVLGASGTPYGDLTVVDRDNRISISSDAPLSEQRDTFTAGVERLDGDSVIRIRANNSTESLETVEQLSYSPGYTGEVGMALQIPEAPTGDQVVRWGYFGPDDGIRWGWDAESLFIQDIRDGTVDQTIRPDEWNGEQPGTIDTPGAIESRVRRALKRGVIARQQLSLYNFGTVGHEVLIPGKDGELTPTRVHTFDSGNQTTLTRQNNPIRIEVENPTPGDFDVFVSDRQATIRGDFIASDRTNGEYRTGVPLSGTTWVPIITLRIKSDVDQIPADLLQFEALPSGSVFIQFRTNAGSANDADYAPPRETDPTETVIEVDRAPDAAITDGFKRFQRLLAGGAEESGGGPPTPTPPTPLGSLPEVDLAIKRDQPVTVFCRLTSGTGGELEACNLQWKEGF